MEYNLRSTLLNNFNYEIEFTGDSKTLYASSLDSILNYIYDVKGGETQIRIFDPTKGKQAYIYGITLGWCLHNVIGLAGKPKDGGIWRAKNNAENINRDGFNIHENNPAKELSNHGMLSDAESSFLNKNYGYLLYDRAWNRTDIPSADRL